MEISIRTSNNALLLTARGVRQENAGVRLIVASGLAGLDVTKQPRLFQTGRRGVKLSFRCPSMNWNTVLLAAFYFGRCAIVCPNNNRFAVVKDADKLPNNRVQRMGGKLLAGEARCHSMPPVR